MIGIGISTRNRPRVLEWTLRHFEEFPSRYKSVIVVVDDNSTDENKEKNFEICMRYNIDYIYNHSRKGVAKTKNICGKALEQLNCKHIFLFDDDTFPRAKNWDFQFIFASEKSKIQHFSYIREVDHIKMADRTSYAERYLDCMGCLCFFTKEAWKQLKGFDESYGLFGFEHADISQRAWKAGLCGKEQGYYSPRFAWKYIYNLDTDFKTLGELTALGPPSFEFASSTAQEPVKDYIAAAGQIFSQKRIY